jgi:hypothetical protein
MASHTGLRCCPHQGPARPVVVLSVLLVLLVFPSASQPQRLAAQTPESPYIGAAACKDCHAAEYESWARSKHASSFRALSDVDAANDTCIGCHSTGVADDLRASDGKPQLPGTQCEACHGPGRAHAAAAVEAASTPRGQGKNLNVKPQTDVCERCHNRQSPRFQGFVYAPMARIVHVHPGR